MKHLSLDYLITPEQKANLLKLALFLLKKYPADTAESTFHMGVFEAVPPSLIHECGTVCCAAGHGPQAGMPKSGRESWLDYCVRVFGAEAFTWSGENHHIFVLLFNPGWTKVDNTPRGAAKRILYLLKFGMPKVNNAYMRILKFHPVYSALTVEELLP